MTATVIAFSGPLVLTLHLQFGIDPVALGSTLVETLDKKTGVTILSCRDPISFQWIAPAAITVDIVTGMVASLLFPRRTSTESAQSGLSV